MINESDSVRPQSDTNRPYLVALNKGNTALRHGILDSVESLNIERNPSSKILDQSCAPKSCVRFQRPLGSQCVPSGGSSVVELLPSKQVAASSNLVPRSRNALSELKSGHKVTFDRLLNSTITPN